MCPSHVCSAPDRYKNKIAQLDGTPSSLLISKTLTKPAMCTIVLRNRSFPFECGEELGRTKNAMQSGYVWSGSQIEILMPQCGERRLVGLKTQHNRKMCALLFQNKKPGSISQPCSNFWPSVSKVASGHDNVCSALPKNRPKLPMQLPLNY